MAVKESSIIDCGELFACARLARSPLIGLVPDFQLGDYAASPPDGAQLSPEETLAIV